MMEIAQPVEVNNGGFGVSVPREIISVILKELPVKTLLRFRCVSRQWRSIIDDDPLFVESHHNRSITRPNGINLLFLTKTWNWELYSPDPEGGPALHLLSVPIPTDEDFPLYSVNGLICFQNCIWNPSTKQRIPVPGLKIRRPAIEMRPGPNPLMVKSLNLLGFDPSSGKHKVLNISQIICARDDEVDDDGEEAQTQFKVLTLSRRGAFSTWRDWRDIDVDSDTDDSSGTVPFMAASRYCSPGSGASKTGCCINGIIYCLGYMAGFSNHVILAFKVGPESFKIMPLPRGGAKSNSCFAVEVGGGRLALINHEVTKIWILEDLDMQLWNMHTLKVNGKSIPIGSTGGVGDLLFHDFNSMFLYYDIETKRVRKDYYDLKLQGNMALHGNMASRSVFIKHAESLF